MKIVLASSNPHKVKEINEYKEKNKKKKNTK